VSLDYSDHLRTESQRFRDVLAEADPAARVPTCPDWTADDLLYHLAEVFTSWTTVVRERCTGDDLRDPDRPADRAGLLALYDGARAALLDVIAATPAEQPIWSWVHEDVTAAWVPRRMAHEALIHRLDAELIGGTVSAVDAELATDGVPEVLQYFYAWRPAWASVQTDAPVGRIAATDTGAEWFVRLDRWSGHSPDSGKAYDGEPCPTLVGAAQPSFEVRGTARDLDAWLWNRPPLDEPVLTGSPEDLAAFRAVVARGVS
jgi:uncharacterized protein (TIGR03083 family)